MTLVHDSLIETPKESDPMTEPTRLFDLMDLQAQKRPLPDAIAAKISGEWVKYSSEDVLLKAREVRAGLYQKGIRPGDKVAIISMNRPEWNFLDLGIQMIGAASVPIYPTASAEDFKYILNHAEVKLVFSGTKAVNEKVQKIAGETPCLIDSYTFDEVEGVNHWTRILEHGSLANSTDLETISKNVKNSDLASIIYTSGTTGTPKGVMLSHNNILSNILAIQTALPPGSFEKALSFLPLCHVFERTVNYYYQSSGVAIYYAESIEAISDNLREVGPEIFVSVPRLLEKIYEKIMIKGEALTGIKKKLFDWSIALALIYEPDKPNGPIIELKVAIARKLVFSKWQEALGGHVKLIVAGGSALQPRLARIFWTAGIKVVEGYGLTETSPVISCNRPRDFRIGTVGAPLPGVELKISAEEGYPTGEGEILTKGPHVMMGYYKNAEATSEVIDKDGWLHTGDIGKLVDNKYLRITDRKKEMFKTSGGKYIAPLALEGKIKESKYIDNVMVTGENKKFPSALILLNWPAVTDWGNSNSVSAGSRTDIAANEKVRDLISDEIQRLNASFGHWEQIKKFRIVSDDWTTETGELTPKLSLKRRVLASKYKNLIESIYEENGGKRDLNK